MIPPLADDHDSWQPLLAALYVRRRLFLAREEELMENGNYLCVRGKSGVFLGLASARSTAPL